jgi:hypothetical protein
MKDRSVQNCPQLSGLRELRNVLPCTLGMSIHSLSTSNRPRLPPRLPPLRERLEWRLTSRPHPAHDTEHTTAFLTTLGKLSTPSLVLRSKGAWEPEMLDIQGKETFSSLFNLRRSRASHIIRSLVSFVEVETDSMDTSSDAGKRPVKAKAEGAADSPGMCVCEGGVWRY